MIPTPRALADQFRRLDIPLPTQAQQALDTLNAIRDAAGRDPGADVRAVVEQGDVTPDTAAQVFDALALDYARAEHRLQAQAALESPVAAQFNAAIRADADKILGQVAKSWKAPAAIVHNAGAYFGPDATADHILNLGADAAAAWKGLQAALDQLDQHRALVVALGELSGRGEQHVSWFVTKVTTREELDAAQRLFTGSGRAFHALTDAGFTLTINTQTQADVMVTTAAAHSDRTAAAAREAALQAHRKSWEPTLAAITATRG